MTDTVDTDANFADFALENSLSHLLHRAQQMAANRSAGALRDAGITLRQFSVLAAVAQETGASQARLVDITGIDRSTLADMLLRMEQSGLVERTRSEKDARAKSVALTAKGAEAMDKAGPAVRDADTALITTLAKNRRAGFLDLLTTLIETQGNGEAKNKTSQEAPKSEKKAKSKAKADEKPKKKKSKKKKKKSKE